MFKGEGASLPLCCSAIMDEDELSHLQGSACMTDACKPATAEPVPPDGMTRVPLLGRLHLDKDFGDAYVLADTITLQQHVFHISCHGDDGLELLFSEDGLEVCNNNVGWGGALVMLFDTPAHM